MKTLRSKMSIFAKKFLAVFLTTSMIFVETPCVYAFAQDTTDAEVVAVQSDAVEAETAQDAVTDEAPTNETPAATTSEAAGDTAATTSEAADAETADAATSEAAQTEVAAEAQTEAAETAEAETVEAETAEAAEERTKTEYVFEDSNVRVVATLSDPTAVPDNAEFRVTPVTSSTSGYNYDAYMSALNGAASDDEAEYTSENTLLYDVAFMVQKTDEEGNALAGEFEEYQPEAGSVAIAFDFKNSQLSDALGAENAEAVEVKHLPLVSEVKNSVESTEAATNISASDIQVESVDAAINVDAETSEFSVDNLSVFAFKADGQTNTWSGSNTFTMASILSALGDTQNYAVYANTLVNGMHLEGNIKVGLLDARASNAVINQDSLVVQRNSATKITVTKTVTKGATGTFNFAVYKEGEAEKGKELYTFSITVPEGQTSASFDIDASSTADDEGHTGADVISTLYGATTGAASSVVIYELDAEGNVLNEGDTLNDTYKVSYSNNTVTASSDISNFDNYIGAITNNGGDAWLDGNYFDSQASGATTYIEDITPAGTNGGYLEGSNYVFTSNGNKVGLMNYTSYYSKIEQKDGIKADVANTLSSLSAYASTLATAKNGATNSYGSLSVINLVSTTGALKTDLENANFDGGGTSDLAGAISQLVTTDGYLLINIDATGYDTYTLNKISIDGLDADAKNEELARHIIYNFVTHDGTKDANGNYSSYSAYTGNITFGGVAAGTVFAPAATVTQQGGLRGMVIADTFYRTGGDETHKDSLLTQTTVNVGVFNTYTGELDYRTSYSGTKIWKDDTAEIRPSSIIVTLFADGVATTYAPVWTKDGDTWTYTFENLPVYNSDGTVIKYTAVESVPGGYDGKTETTQTSYQLDLNSKLTTATANMSTEFAIDGQGIGMVVGQKADGGFVMWTSVELTDEAKAAANTVAANALGSAFDAANCTYVSGNPQGISEGDSAVTIAGKSGYGNVVGINFAEGSTLFTKWAYGTLKANYSAGTTKFTNRYRTGNLTVEKVWQDSDGNEREPLVDSISVDLHQTLTKQVYTETSHKVNVTLKYETKDWDGSNAKTFEIPVSAMVTDGGTAVVNWEWENWHGAAPTVTVEGVDGTEHTYGDQTKQSTLTISNVTSDLNITVTADAANDPILSGAFITGDVDAGKEVSSDDVIKTVTLSAANNWRVDFSIGAEEGDLPAADKDGNVYKYYFSEATTGAWTTAYENNGGITTGVVTITNTGDATYKATGSAAINVEKSYANWGDADSFTFKLEAVNDEETTGTNPLASAKTVTLTKDKQSSAFDEISFSEAGTYKFKVTEVLPTDANGNALTTKDGITYDTSVHYVTVVMTDDHEGHLVPTYTYTTDGEGATAAKFTNSYSADGTSIELEAHKNFKQAGLLNLGVFDTDKALAGGEFTFILSSDEAGEDVIGRASNDKDGKVTFSGFDQLNYTQAGTYTYYIRESIPADADKLAGVTYDETVYKVTVTVSDSGAGKLEAHATYEANGKTSESADFTNRYAATEAKAQLKVTKNFASWGSANVDSFGFTLTPSKAYAVDGTTEIANPLTEAVEAEVTQTVTTAQFGEITYKQAGTYTYFITENLPADGAYSDDGKSYIKDGISYDITSYKVVVTVADVDGHLVATPKYNVTDTNEGTDTLEVTNTYESAKGFVVLEATKHLNGANIKDYRFSFTLSEKVGSELTPIETVTNDENGKITFAPIEYEETGAHTYVITEVASGVEDGITYDKTQQEVTVEVADNGAGQLVATPTYKTAGGASFTNTYAAKGKATIQATKSFNNWSKAADGFTFKLKAGTEQGTGEASPMPASDTSTAATEANPTATFDEITFTKAGTYTYTITEVAGTVDGVAYDGASRQVKVVATDDGKGNINTRVVYVDAEGNESETPSVFTNTYHEGTSTELKATKLFASNNWPGEQTFKFTLTAGTDADGAASPMPEGTTNGTKTVEVTKNSPVALFGNIVYDKAGTYIYTISEVVAAEGAEKGVTFDTAAHAVKVVVTENADGTLTPEVTYDENQDSLTITNEYATTNASAEVAVKKSYNNWGDSESFTFTLHEVSAKDEANNDIDTTIADKQVTVSDANAVNFETLEFTQAGTYRFKITENAGTNPGISYSTAEHYVTIKVTDNGLGELKASVEYEDENDEAAGAAQFENTYTADGTFAVLMAQKTYMVNGNTATLEGGEFSFALSYDEAGKEVITTATNDENGNVVFSGLSALTFTKADTYTFYIRENIPADENKVAGVEYDTSVYKAVVTVTDNGQGSLVAADPVYTVVGAQDSKTASVASFTNTYQVEDTELALEVTKDFNAWDTAKTQSFDFVLTGGTAVDAEGNTISNPLETGTTQTATATKDAKTATFAALKYTQAGTYNYTIAEVVPEDAAGVTYDTTIYNVVVTVADVNGKLVATPKYNVTSENAGTDSLTVTNTYATGEATATLVSKKQLTGGTLTDGMFNFTLSEKQADGSFKEIQTVTNKGENITFTTLNYTEPGEHTYKITELNEGVSGVTYDATEHLVTVNVTDDGKGNLSAEVTYDGSKDAPVFTNTYFGADSQLSFDKYFYGSDGSFEFTLQAADEQGNALAADAKELTYQAGLTDGKLTATVNTFDENFKGSVVFNKIRYSKAGTYYYTVSENADAEGTTVMDETVYLVKVTVSDDATVTTEIKVLGSDGDFAQMTSDNSAFYNNQMVSLHFASFGIGEMVNTDAVVLVDPVATKKLVDVDGETIAMSGNEFAFELVDSAGNPLQTVGNTADGAVLFDALRFTEVGTYTYTVHEVAGESASITYDETVFTLTVDVTKDGDTLKATTTYTDAAGNEVAEPTFTNTYDGYDIRVQKVSRYGGEGLVDCVYALWMVTDHGDVEVGEATSDESGYITFKDVDIIKGTKYYFKEVKAPEGHTVDPYRTAYFTLNDDGTGLVLAEETAEDGWHAAGYQDNE